MKKFFSFTFAIMLLISVVGLVGCNGLWDFDDDDDVTVMPVNFNFLGKIAFGTASFADLTLYKGYVYYEGTTPDSTFSNALNAQNPFSVDAVGSFTADFNAIDGRTFYIVFAQNNSTALKLYRYFNKKKADMDSYDSTNPAIVNEETTAVGIILQSDSSKTYGDVTEADAATVGSEVNDLVTLINAVGGDLDQTALTIPVKTVTVDPAGPISLEFGKTQSLTATVNPVYATNNTVTWRSDNTSVATVDSAGVVTAGTTEGTANIIATAGGVDSAAVVVTVTAAPIAVTGVTLNKASTSLTTGASETLVATVAPAGATTKTVTWKSSNTAVATVDQTGKVTAVAAGSATITVTTTDGSKTATCVVTVTAASSGTTNVTLSANVSGKTLSELIIKIEGVDSTFTTTTTLTGSDSKTWTLAKDSDLTTQYGTLVLIAQNVTFADFLTTYNEFNSLVFTTALPTGSKVTVLSQNTTPATELATSGTL